MPPSRPDAVKIPAKLAPGGFAGADSHEAIALLAEEGLGIDLDSDELAHCRDQMTYFFCTRDPADTMYHPSGSPRAGKPRYRWEDLGDGVQAGWLIDE